jgi:hypothetical protein
MQLAHKALIPLMFFHWLGWKISAAYMLGLMMILIINQIINTQRPILKIGMWSLIVVGIFSAINLYSLIDVENQSVVFFNWYYYCGLFILIFVVGISGPWESNELHITARIIFWVAFYSIAIEFILVNFFDIPNTLMPAARLSSTYVADIIGWYRPFGLTGQSSVNGGVLLFTFLLLVQIEKNNIKYMLALAIGSILTISGQAILSSFSIAGLILLANFKNSFLKLVFQLLLFLIIFLILSLNLFQKISLDYLLYVLWDRSYLLENFESLDTWEILFGTLGGKISDEISSEVWLISAIQIYGVLFLIIFWTFTWILLKKTRHPFIYFYGCFISSLHYPSIIFIEAQLPLILIYISCLKYRIKQNSI